jgi:FkbM family methyltransferase
MKSPHFLRYLKYRADFYATYFTSLGLADGWRCLRLLRLSRASKNELRNVRLESFKLSLWVRRNPADIDAFEKIFVLRQYEVPFPGEPAAILDLGGNIGLSAVWYALKYPKTTIVVLEPEASNYQLLLRNVAPFKNVFPLQAAIWSRTGHFKISNPTERPDGFRMIPCESGKPGAIVGYDVAGLATKFGRSFDYVKVDIEGAEKELFAPGCAGWLQDTRLLVAEFHGDDLLKMSLPEIHRFPFSSRKIGENHVFTRTTADAGV